MDRARPASMLVHPAMAMLKASVGTAHRFTLNSHCPPSFLIRIRSLDA